MTQPLLDIPKTRELIQQFSFQKVFTEQLGWSNPTGVRIENLALEGETFTCKPLAGLGGVVVYEVTASGGGIPDGRHRLALHKKMVPLRAEHLLVFVDDTRRRSLWYWVKREDGKTYPRDHYFQKGQPGDLFLGKLGGLIVDISELDEQGQASVVTIAQRLKSALDIERATKKFYRDFDDQRVAFTSMIRGIRNDRDRGWYATALLNRMMFIYFLQKKHFLDGGNEGYLQDKLAGVGGRDAGRFYSEFLQALFFEGFAKPTSERSSAVSKLIGRIPYLNGGLFVPHEVEQRYEGKISIPDAAFENLLTLFGRYTWHLDDTPGGKDDELNPDVLGYIFEKYINQKEFGAYYTRPEITDYLCEQTIHQIVLGKVNAELETMAKLNTQSTEPTPAFQSISELLMKLDDRLCNRLINDHDGILPSLSLLDPACGSGAFLIAAMKTLINLYSAVIGRMELGTDAWAKQWLKRAHAEHKSLTYFIKKQIITRNLYGVDLMREASEIARLRLFLALVASAQTIDELEPLPNIDFNILCGNSLIGHLRVDDEAFDQKRGATSQLSLGLTTARKSYAAVVAEKNRLIDGYRNHPLGRDALQTMKQDIDAHRSEANKVLNDLLLDQMQAKGVGFEQATWDPQTQDLGKPRKRALNAADIAALQPFHWGYEFDRIMALPDTGGRGGFDAIITNPPWEIVKPQAKEFFAEYSEVVTKKKMTIKEFEKEQGRLLKDSEVRDLWLEYLNRFPHESAWFRSAPQYANQSSIVNGKKTGSDINLYKLFTEQCFNLLRPGGLCGIVIPSGIYTDLGAKGLRELLFSRTRVSGLFCFENRKEIFENVHRSFKFVVLSFEKGGHTENFPAAFMRHDVVELTRFPAEGALSISVPFVRRLSPDSVSVMEFKSGMDVQIAEKMLRFPLLGEKIDGVWNLKLTAEFHMTNDSYLFKTSPGKGRLPLYEGKMIHQFDAHFSEPNWWVEEREARATLLGKGVRDTGQLLNYQHYRLGFRDIAASTNERSAIASIIPSAVFAGNTLPLHVPNSPSAPENVELLGILSIFNSFAFDWLIRKKITSHLNMFYVFQMPVPRLTPRDAGLVPLASRAAQLVCLSDEGLRPEFDALWRGTRTEIGAKQLPDPSSGRGISAATRNRLRAELDGLVAHLYGLTEAEFAHVLAAFPIVGEPVKVAVHNAYRDVERGTVR